MLCKNASSASWNLYRYFTHLPGLPCREFLLSSYAELKKANPKFPILVRECSGVEAKLIARYGRLKRANQLKNGSAKL